MRIEWADDESWAELNAAPKEQMRCAVACPVHSSPASIASSLVGKPQRGGPVETPLLGSSGVPRH
jgi:hypothetical protein